MPDTIEAAGKPITDRLRVIDAEASIDIRQPALWVLAVTAALVAMRQPI